MTWVTYISTLLGSWVWCKLVPVTALNGMFWHSVTFIHTLLLQMIHCSHHTNYRMACTSDSVGLAFQTEHVNKVDWICVRVRVLSYNLILESRERFQERSKFLYRSFYSRTLELKSLCVEFIYCAKTVQIPKMLESRTATVPETTPAIYSNTLFCRVLRRLLSS